ncbi:MAG: minor capsid protein [Methyloprofundus sp.]|nr:minor capsid protein [Methyloprofundus sp.]
MTDTTQGIKIQLETQNRRGKNRLPRRMPDPTGIAREYRAFIRAVADDYGNALKEILYPALEVATNQQKGQRMDGWVDTLANALDALDARAAAVVGGLRPKIIEFADKLGRFNQTQFQRAINSTWGVNVTLNEPWLVDELKSWAEVNSKLVSSVPVNAQTDVARIAQEGVRSGRNVRDIQREIQSRFNVQRNRAQTIARTETAKLNSELSERRQTALGIDTYYWATSRDERVRPDHDVLDGMLCRWDDPTVYSDDDGETWGKRSSIGGYEGNPGTDYNCRCGSVANTTALLKSLGV